MAKKAALTQNVDKIVENIGKSIVDSVNLEEDVIKAAISEAITNLLIREAQDRKKRLIRKDYRVKKEVTELKKLFDHNAIEVNSVMKTIIRKYCYLKVTLKDMEKEIDDIGLTMYYTNKGGNTNLTKNPLIPDYKSYIKEFTAIAKQIMELLKLTINPDNKDAFQEFMDQFKTS